ncbi:MAG TPA: hypothetical protein PLL75_04795 [Candidatus Omnitrophota bacterium]|nr:hypothetical protein [Candidatus Omnitrophota bacterium]HPS37027.1 hypothetical protein [Candidatus Omnitrophota bacterium]
MRPPKLGFFFLFFFLTMSSLFAGSITNEGDTPVKVSGKSVNGISGSSTIPPGKTAPIRQKFLWLEHIPEGREGEIRIKITEDNGTVGYITSPGEKYFFKDVPEKSGSEMAASATAAQPLKPGYATNYSNVQIYLTFISDRGAQRTQVAMPGQMITVPENTVEVRTEPFNTSYGDAIISVTVMMPDGAIHSIRSARGSVQLGQKGDRPW